MQNYIEDVDVRISTDTRTIEKGDFYLPLKGVSFDGEKFVEQALEKGAIGAFVTKAKQYDGIIFQVPDTLTAYLQLANFRRNKLNYTVVGVTGSSGKTTTKEMLYSVISQKFNTHKSYLNYNNQFGLCKTLLEMPDKKLEKVSKNAVKRILSNHRLMKIIKLPEPLFFGIGVTTSVFVFKAGEPQDGKDIFGCYMEDDGLETVKNQGRHDVRNKWQTIEDYWIECVRKLRDEKFHTDQWIDPAKHLSYQMPEIPFEISEEDFRKTAMNYLCFKKGIDTKEFCEKLVNVTLYLSEIHSDERGISVVLGKGGEK